MKQTCLLFFSILSISSRLYGNGAAWSSPNEPGTPGPLKQTDLFLDRESVTFKEGKVKAVFFVKNPAPKDITTQMGFPIKLSGYNRGLMNEDPGHARLSDFRIQTDGKDIEAVFSTSTMNEKYPIVYLWKMTFPANQTLEYTVDARRSGSKRN